MYMKIKNVTLFFVGVIVLILGILIIIFDYPQIQFLENINLDSNYKLDEQQKSIHQRLIIEFSIGVVILMFGISLLISSFLKRFENGLR